MWTLEPVRGEIIVNVLVDGLGAGFPQDLFPTVDPTGNLETLLADEKLPNFKRLITDAAGKRIIYNGNTTFPSITFSAWSSWVTGREPAEHGVTGSNFFRRDEPSADPFWCRVSTDPTCAFPEFLGGMLPPFNLVLFFDPKDGILDLDTANLWSYIGTLNSAIRPMNSPHPNLSPIMTIYERMSALGLISAVVYHFPFRGATYTSFDTPLEGLVAHADTSGRKLDLAATKRLNNLMGLEPLPENGQIRAPQVLTVYYPGLDTRVHNDFFYPFPDGGPFHHLEFLDGQVGSLIRILDQWNLFDDAIFTFTGDHGLSRVGDYDEFSMTLKNTEELLSIMRAAGFEPLDFALEADRDSVIAINGGMAHVYVKNSNPFSVWFQKPLIADVLSLADAFIQANRDFVIQHPEHGPEGWLDLVLIRDPIVGFPGPYQVRYFDTGTNVFTTVSLAEASDPPSV